MDYSLEQLPKLNFPSYPLSIQIRTGKAYIFDIIRKKYILLQPEEWVRQHALWYLLYHKNYPKSLIAVEKQLRVGHLNKRYDIVSFTCSGSVELIVECKAPKVAITQDVFDQIARYNLSLKSRYLMVTNGNEHYFYQMDYSNGRYIFLNDLPCYVR